MSAPTLLKSSASSLGREIYSLTLEAPPQLADAVSALPAEHFVLFLAWDARAESNETITSVARLLVARGLAYVVAWGPDCERVHDIFDAVDNELHPVSETPGTDTVIMSTWHDKEPLEEALWFALFSAYPAAPYDQSCTATVAAAIANPEWGTTISRYVADLASLNRAVRL